LAVGTWLHDAGYASLLQLQGLVDWPYDIEKPSRIGATTEQQSNAAGGNGVDVDEVDALTRRGDIIEASFAAVVESRSFIQRRFLPVGPSINSKVSTVQRLPSFPRRQSRQTRIINTLAMDLINPLRNARTKSGICIHAE
jgi:hypothetical protein